MPPVPRPFVANFPQAELADLKARLQRTRLPDRPVDPGWRYGVDPDYMRRLLAHWRDGFDWCAQEARLNRFPQFAVELPLAEGGSIELHFHHERGSGKAQRALILTHGWPGSTFEFLDCIEPLAHPERFGGKAEDGFDVVVPSLPGYGLSAPPPAPIGPRAIATLWHRLMAEVLGYRRYCAQGGDWGAVITAWLALQQPDAVSAAHFNMLPLRAASGPSEPALATDERAWIEAARRRLRQEDAYQHVHATKSQTLAYGLTDSPAGLAAWIVEKFHGWSDPAAAEPPFAMDALLANVTLYWLTGRINSSTWLYRAVREEKSLALPAGQRLTQPLGFLLPGNDLTPPPPDGMLRRLGKLAERRDLPQAGHFTAMQAPGPFVAAVRDFFLRHAH
jgi:microsomal epoxide hydrolase